MNSALHDVARTLAPTDSDWPRRLTELRQPPEMLRIAGSFPELGRSVAIVGTRRASRDALTLTEEWARELAAEEVVIVSGGAEGIDAAAHRGALEAEGRTVVVLAGGLARPFPVSHLPLFQRASRRGAVISEAPDDAPSYRGAFLKRNRLIACLAKVVLVIQAPSRSGALSTAAAARQLGRPLLAVPWSLADPHARGGIDLLASGAATLCRGPADIRASLGDAPKRASRRTKRTQACARSLEEGRILSTMSSAYVHADHIVRETGLDPASVQRVLMTLLLQGDVERDLRGAFRRTYRYE